MQLFCSISEMHTSLWMAQILYMLLAFLAVPWVCLHFVIVFPDHTHLLFLKYICYNNNFCEFTVWVLQLLQTVSNHSTTYTKELIYTRNDQNTAVEDSTKHVVLTWVCALSGESLFSIRHGSNPLAQLQSLAIVEKISNKSASQTAHMWILIFNLVVLNA